MSGNSVGGLFLQVKLKTDGLEQQFLQIARSANAITSNLQRNMQNLTVQSRSLADNMAQINRLSGRGQQGAGMAKAAEETAAATARAAQSTQQVANAAKQAADASKNFGLDFNSLASRTMTKNLQDGVKARLQLERLAEKEAQAEGLVAEKAARAAQAEKQKATAATQAAAAMRQQASIGSVLGSGSQELFVGLGAARSGNYFYGLAALARYGKNVGAAMTGMSAGAAVGAASIAAVGVAAIAAGGSLAYLTAKIGEVGISSAVNLQLLRTQFSGLLGSASAAQEELQYLIDLTQESTVPAEGLIAIDRSLIAAGISSQKLRQELTGSLSTIGTALGLTADQFGGIAYAMSQIANLGKAYMLDFRQFSNNGIPQAKLIAAIAKETGRTYQEVLADISDGGIAAQDVFKGLISLGYDLKDVAEATKGTVAGLTQNIQEKLTLGIGSVFEQSGVADSLAEILKKVQAGVDALLVAVQPTAAAFNNLFKAVGEAFDTGGGGFAGADPMTVLFGQIIPGAINTAAAAIRLFGRIAKAIGPVIIQTFRSVGDSIAAVKDVVVQLAPVLGLLGGSMVTGWIMGLTALGIAFRALAATVLISFYNLKSLYLLLSGDMAGAFAAQMELTGKLKEQWDGITSAIQAAKDAEAALANLDLSGLNPDVSPAPIPLDPVVEEPMVDQAAQGMQDAIDSLRQSMQRFLGARSDFEQGLLGTGKGFTQSADQIIASAKGIRDSIKEAFPPGAERSRLIDILKTQTLELARLATRRDRIADQLAEAQKKYEDILAEQDSFANGIVSGFTSFVNSLQLEEREVTTFTENSGDGFAGWVSETKTQTEDFQDALKRRLQALKDFVSNIRTLQSRGLDPALVKQLIEAGPEAAGEVASQLAGAGQGTIRQVNRYQRELNSIASSFASEQASIYYDAGVAAAKGQVDGFQSKLDTITKQASDIVNGIRKELMKATKPAEEAGKAVGEGFASGLQSMIESVIGVAHDAAKGVRRELLKAVPSGEAIQRRIAEYERSIAQGVTVPPYTGSTPVAADYPYSPTALQPDQIDAASGPVLVQVQIGERDITDIVDVRYKRLMREEALAGRRGKRTP